MNEKIKETRFNPEKAQCYFSKMLAFTLGPIELKSLMDEGKVKVVDVRKAEDYEIAHIPTAISIPEAQIPDELDKLSKEEVSVVYCYNQQCHLGAKAALTLAQYGYPVMLLEGGFKTWTEDFRFATVKKKPEWAFFNIVRTKSENNFAGVRNLDICRVRILKCRQNRILCTSTGFLYLF